MTSAVDSEDFKKDTEIIIVNTLERLAEGVTGIAASKQEELILSIGHIFQGIRGGQFLSIFLKEWNSYQEKGRIKEDYPFTDQNYTCLHELLDFLEKDIPDEIRFNFLKRLFIVAAMETVSSRESMLPQQYMKICKILTTGEILVLLATYRVAKDGKWKSEKHYSARSWFETIAKESGLIHTELVEIHEQRLINNKLITDRTHGDRSGVSVGQHYRLTELGYEICKFVESYEPCPEE